MGWATCSLNNERRTGQNHSVDLKQPLHPLLLVVGIGLIDRLLARRKVFVFGQHLKELLDLSGRLVGIDDLCGDTYRTPHVFDVTWNEHGFTGAEVESLLANLQLHLALNDVNPFILFGI